MTLKLVDIVDIVASVLPSLRSHALREASCHASDTQETPGEAHVARNWGLLPTAICGYHLGSESSSHN